MDQQDGTWACSIDTTWLVLYIANNQMTTVKGTLPHRPDDHSLTLAPVSISAQPLRSFMPKKKQVADGK